MIEVNSLGTRCLEHFELPVSGLELAHARSEVNPIVLHLCVCGEHTFIAGETNLKSAGWNWFVNE